MHNRKYLMDIVSAGQYFICRSVNDKMAFFFSCLLLNVYAYFIPINLIISKTAVSNLCLIALFLFIKITTFLLYAKHIKIPKANPQEDLNVKRPTFKINSSISKRNTFFAAFRYKGQMTSFRLILISSIIIIAKVNISSYMNRFITILFTQFLP